MCNGTVPRVLLIEDNVTCAMLTKKHILKALPGADIVTYTKLMDAVNDLMGRPEGYYALIVVDLKLSDGAWGTMAIPPLYAADRRTPIVILTGGEADGVAEALRYGARSYLLKNASADLIVQGLKKVVFDGEHTDE